MLFLPGQNNKKGFSLNLRNYQPVILSHARSPNLFFVILILPLALLMKNLKKQVR